MKSSLEAAAQAAARVNAQLIAKGKLKSFDLGNNYIPKKGIISVSTSGKGIFSAEVEINDVPQHCRNYLTKGATQDEIYKASGAAVSTRGRFMMNRLHTSGERPLYLHIQGPTQESVDRAVERVKATIQSMSMSLPPPAPAMISVEQSYTTVPPPQAFMTPSAPIVNTAPRLLEDRVYIGVLEESHPAFNFRERLKGPGGCYLHHIEAETGTTVLLIGGRMNDHNETLSPLQPYQPMHIYLQHNNSLSLAQAKALAVNLVETVQQEYEAWRRNGIVMPTAGSVASVMNIQNSTMLPPALVSVTSIPTSSATTHTHSNYGNGQHIVGASHMQVPQSITVGQQQQHAPMHVDVNNWSSHIVQSASLMRPATNSQSAVANHMLQTFNQSAFSVGGEQPPRRPLKRRFTEAPDEHTDRLLMPPPLSLSSFVRSGQNANMTSIGRTSEPKWACVDPKPSLVYGYESSDSEEEESARSSTISANVSYGLSGQHPVNGSSLHLNSSARTFQQGRVSYNNTSKWRP